MSLKDLFKMPQVPAGDLDKALETVKKALEDQPEPDQKAPDFASALKAIQQTKQKQVQRIRFRMCACGVRDCPQGYYVTSDGRTWWNDDSGSREGMDEADFLASGPRFRG